MSFVDNGYRVVVEQRNGGGGDTWQVHTWEVSFYTSRIWDEMAMFARAGHRKIQCSNKRYLMWGTLESVSARGTVPRLLDK